MHQEGIIRRLVWAVAAAVCAWALASCDSGSGDDGGQDSAGQQDTAGADAIAASDGLNPGSSGPDAEEGDVEAEASQAQDSAGADSAGGGCAPPDYDDLDGFFDFLAGDYAVTRIEGGGLGIHAAVDSYASIELQIRGGDLDHLQVYRCDDAGSCGYDVGYGGNADFMADPPFDMTATETNVFFLTELNTMRSVFYEHATCMITLEIRSTVNPANWAQLIHEPAL